MNKLLAGIIAVSLLLVITVVAYLIYKGTRSECDTIFQQAAVSLKTNVKFIEAEGAAYLGTERVQELTERAQVAALNLKTCCIALNLGRLAPDQFLECKQEARSYDTQIERLASLVRDARSAGDDPAAERRTAEALSRTVRMAQASFEKLEKTAAAAAPETERDDGGARSAASEQEPNDEILKPNAAGLETWTAGEIGSPQDADYFRFTTPPVYRDWMVFELENRSTSLKPHMRIYDARRSERQQAYDGTPGANLEARLVAEPGSEWYVLVTGYAETAGAYRLRVRPAGAYDRYEPNDGPLQAAPVAAGEQVEANIMDAGDQDYYRIEITQAGTVSVSLKNRSRTLKPYLAFYDPAKSNIAEHYDNTPGADLRRSFAASGPGAYFVRVSNYANTQGAYSLEITLE